MAKTKFIWKGSKKELLNILDFNSDCIENDCSEHCSLMSTDIEEHFESYYSYSYDLKYYGGVR